MVTAAKPAPQPLQVLLVGKREEDFFLIREILERNRSLLAAELDHARSIDEAKSKLQQRPYGLVLFEHETGDAEAVRLVSQFQHAGVSVPFLLLTEDADEKNGGGDRRGRQLELRGKVATGRRDPGSQHS